MSSVRHLSHIADFAAGLGANSKEPACWGGLSRAGGDGGIDYDVQSAPAGIGDRR